MRILEISYRDPYGVDAAGVESYILKLREFLTIHGNTVDIVYASINRKNNNGLKPIYIPGIIQKLGLNKFYYNLELVFLVRSNRENYDIVHINGDNGVLVPYIKRVKTIMTLHGSMKESARLKKKYFTLKSLLSYILDSIMGGLENFACSKSNKVIAVSNDVADYFEKNRKKGDIVVINTCIEPPEKSEVILSDIEHIKKNGKILALWIGRDPIRKGLYIAKNAIKNLNGVELITIGYSDNSIQDNVINLGYVSNKTLYTLYHMADIIIFPSINEGFSIALLEAMSYGCIPVAFNIPSTEELIDDNKNGFLVNDEDQLHDKLVWLIENKQIIDEIKPNAVLKAEDYYCDKILPEVYALFEDLYNEKKPL